MHINEVGLPMIKHRGNYIASTHYRNSNGFAAAIVATVAVTGHGIDKILDWTAYLGGSDKTQRQEDAILHIADMTGCKLSKQDACYFFPELKDEWYRT